MFGPGRPAKRPSIDGVRELTSAELDHMSHGKSPAAKRFRDSHHRVARLFASGCRPGEVAERSGYSLGRISTLSADPAFQELVASYRSSVDESWKDSVDEYYDTVIAVRTMSARLIHDKLSETEPDDVSFRELVTIHADAADRTGYGKRSTQVNVNTDFASLLDQAIKRSNEAKIINNEPSEIEGPIPLARRA